MEPFSRRRFLRIATLSWFGFGMDGAWSQTRTQNVDDPTMEVWMETWMREARVRDVKGALHLTRFADPIYVLTEPIRWSPNPGQQFQAVDVPKYFVTDLASIPRLFYTLLRPDGVYTFPAIVHDYLYWTQIRPRQEADEIFKLAM